VPVQIPEGFGHATASFRCNGVQNPMCITWGFSHVLRELEGSDNPNVIAQALHVSMYSPATAPFQPAFVSSAYTLVNTDVVMMQDGELKQGSWIQPRVGTSGFPCPPPNCAHLVRKKTGRSGKQHRGRMYVPACLAPESTINDAGVWDAEISFATHAGHFQSWLDDMYSKFLPMVILHNDPAEPPTPVTTLQLQQLLATQRRRMR